MKNKLVKLLKELKLIVDLQDTIKVKGETIENIIEGVCSKPYPIPNNIFDKIKKTPSFWFKLRGSYIRANS